LEIDLQGIINPTLLTFKTVGVSLVLFLAVGVPIAYLLSFKKLQFRWFLDTFVTLPLIFPPIAVGFFLLLLLGKNGFIGSFFARFDISFIFTFNGLVIAGFVAGLPLMVKPLQSAIELFPMSIKEASYMSGKGAFYTLVFIILPSIKKSLFACLIIASTRAMGEVGITLMLGGNIIGKTDTMSLAIYNAVFDGEHELALVLSGVLVIISLIFFVGLHFLQKER
jgi:molybdate transport system permease protein